MVEVLLWAVLAVTAAHLALDVARLAWRNERFAYWRRQRRRRGRK